MQTKKAHCHKFYAYATPFEELQTLLASGKYDPNSNDAGFNGLHASMRAPTAVAKQLITLFLRHGTDINSRNTNGYNNTPLHTFIANERTEDTLYLINEAVKLNIKINFNIPDFEGKTLLILAAKIRNETIALHILKMAGDSIDINAVDKNGMAAAHYACALGLPNLLKALINKGANLTSECHKKRKPIEYIEISDNEIVSMLNSVSIDPKRDEFAKQNYVCDENFQPLATLHPFMAPKHHDDILALKTNRAVVAKILEDSILDSHYIHILQSQGFQGLEAAQKLFSNSLNTSRKQVILKQFDEMSGISVKDAVKRNHPEIRDILLAHGVSYDKLIRLYAANDKTAKLSHILSLPDIAKHINKAGVPSGKTALHLAAAKGLLEICTRLVTAGATLDCIDADGNTPLLLACIAGKDNTVIFLIKKGADVGVKNKVGNNIFSLLKTTNPDLLTAVLAELNNRDSKKQPDTPITLEENSLTVLRP